MKSAVMDEAGRTAHDAALAVPAGHAAGDEDAIRPVKHAVPPVLVEDVDAIRPGRRDSSGRPEISDPQPGGPATQPVAVLLNGRFVRDAQGQYRRSGETRVALADEGGQIRFVDKQMDAFEAGVELAKAKGWMTIEVTGSEKFKEQAWFHASVSGLEVVGFEPTEAALARLAQAKQPREAAERAPQTPPLHAQAAPATQGMHTADLAAGAPQAQTPGDTRVPADELLASRQDAQKLALFLNRSVRVTDDQAGRYAGRLIHETQHHVVQDIGRNVAVLHQKAALGGTEFGQLVGTSTNVRINYRHGRGAVDIPVKATPEHAR